MKNRYLPIIACIGISIGSLNAQEKTDKELKGDQYAFKYAYDRAIESYTEADPLTTEGQRNLADSYHKMNQDAESEAAYSTLISSPNGVLAEDYYNYAMILKSNGKYDESAKYMDRFQQQRPDDLRAKSYEENKGELNALLMESGKYKVISLNINTEDEDFATAYYQDKIVFASSRSSAKMFRKKYNLNGKPFLNLYVAEVEDGQLKNPEKFDKLFKGKMHDGPACFSKNGLFMAFTKNHRHDRSKDKVVELQLFLSSSSNGKWSTPVSFEYNNAAYSVAHPFLTADGNTMYFTSDMPGGFGGADLYRTTKSSSGSWSKPENLGNRINTEGDELFPFLEETKQTLYFSSNGHFGLGGLDIFSYQMDGSGKVINAGSYLNTRADDYALILNEETKKGYFSSNRSGGSGDDDLYAFDVLKSNEIRKKIEGLAKDEQGKPVPSTFITLFDNEGIRIDTMTSGNDGAYFFLVDADKNFGLRGHKETYKDGENTASTFGEQEIVRADVILLQEKEKEIEVNEDLAITAEIKSIYFDYDKYEIRPDAATELDKIVKIMNKFPTMEIQLGAHTDCRGEETYNMFLSDFRAKATANYIRARISNPSRITEKGYGETKLLNSCACDGENVSGCTTEEHQKNRRSEFIVTKK